MAVADFLQDHFVRAEGDIDELKASKDKSLEVESLLIPIDYFSKKL